MVLINNNEDIMIILGKLIIILGIIVRNKNYNETNHDNNSININNENNSKN